MVQLKVCPMGEMLKVLGERKIVCFGAGKHFITFWGNNPELREEIIAVIDNSPDLCGQQIQGYPICSIEELIRNERSKYIIMITSTLRWMEMIKQLDSISYFDDIDCYWDIWNTNKQKFEKLEILQGKQKIPKKIHYCWFGGQPIPKRLQKYMDSWKKYCPDYEIIRWDESNYDVAKCNYTEQAYNAEKWAFVSDYARLDVVHEHGGIYLDTDVELIRNLDELLSYDLYCGFESEQYVALGLGFGAVSGHPLLERFMRTYENTNFINDGEINYTTCPVYQSKDLEEEGFVMNGKYQEVNGIAIFPCDVFAPRGKYGFPGEIIERTYSIHHYEATWIGNQDEGKKKQLEIMDFYSERVRNHGR